MISIKYKTIAASFLCFILTLSGCSVSPEYRFNEEYDFSQIKSYSLFPRESKFSSIQQLSDFERNRIELTIEEEMERFALVYKDFEEADVVVSYFFVERSLKELKAYNKGVGACLGCSDNQQKQLNKDIKTSMLIVDVLGNEKKRSIYRSFVDMKLDEKDTSDENNAVIKEAVRNVLANFPVANNPAANSN
ncbi:DUF4136 domain-containing protein [Thalassomonas sp. M1454]|uniref:DUF4136 domain-containing protein n=1 Tax=Thalassomonas sp. M1454 TaxID=2594477 RepID=UPI00117FA4CF|nr:DUF4136 domain-containing protein [Thalassomonas sp. M1454]TRX55895.1 DUF4136 domain-containing protein [Thalassomonas sp. M1454]